MKLFSIFITFTMFVLSFGNTTYAQDNHTLQNTTIWRSRATLIVLDLQGNLLNEIDLPHNENDMFLSDSVSHNGQYLAYITNNREDMVAHLYVFDVVNEELLIEADLPNDYPSFLSLHNSRHFNQDDTAFAFGYYESQEAGWNLFIYDLQTGEIIKTLTVPINRNLVPFDGLYGQYPLIYGFEDNIVTFVTLYPHKYPRNSENAVFDTVDWDISTETFAHNCLYTHLLQDTLDTTGEIIEASRFQLLHVQSSDTLSNTRQVVFQNENIPFKGVSFIQNGERVVAWGDDLQLIHGVLLVLERDGTVLEQIDVANNVSVVGTNDGFLYANFMDTPDSITEINYVDTREGTQTVIWKSEPNEYFFPVWADMYSIRNETNYLSWANFGILHGGECPPQRG